MRRSNLLLTRAETELRMSAADAGGRVALRAMADGDGRYLLNMAEQIAALPEQTPPMDPGALSELLARAPRCTTRIGRSITI